MTTASARVGVLSVVLLAVVAVALLALPLRSTNQVYGPLTEDGYYSLTVARNVAEGHGVTADSLGAPTNGFQPLFTFVTVPIFWIAGTDPVLALRLVLLLQILVLLATGLVLGGVVADTFPAPGLRRRAVVVLTAVAYSSALFAISNGLNGLETGFLLLLYAIAWRRYQRRGVATLRDTVLLGLLLGALVLTRIDAAVFVAVLCGSLAFRRHRDGVVRAALVGGTALVVSAPWWLYNVVQFGSLLPSSERAEQAWALSGTRLESLVNAWSQAGVPWLRIVGQDNLLGLFVGLAIVTAGVAWGRWLRRHPTSAGVAPAEPTLDEGGVARSKHFAVLLGVTAALLSLWYLFSSHAYYFYGRYLGFLVLLAVFGWMRLALLVWARWPAALVSAFAILAVGGVIVVIGFSTSPFTPKNLFYRDQLALVDRYVPERSVVAAGQSGTLGFFRDRVLNLDGKVNDDALDHRDDLDTYLGGVGVHWVCDWPSVLESFLPDYQDHGWRTVARRGAFVLIERGA